MSDWTPLSSAVEGPVGTWRLIDPSGREYGLVRRVRVDGESKYRAEREDRVAGFGDTLATACEIAGKEALHEEG